MHSCIQKELRLKFFTQFHSRTRKITHANTTQTRRRRDTRAVRCVAAKVQCSAVRNVSELAQTTTTNSNEQQRQTANSNNKQATATTGEEHVSRRVNCVCECVRVCVLRHCRLLAMPTIMMLRRYTMIMIMIMMSKSA